MTDDEYRIQRIERDIAEIQKSKPEVMANELSHVQRALAEVRDEVRTMKRAFYTFALSVSGSAVLFALTVFMR